MVGQVEAWESREAIIHRAAFVWRRLVAARFRPAVHYLVTINLTMPCIAYTGSASCNYITCLALVGVWPCDLCSIASQRVAEPTFPEVTS